MRRGKSREAGEMQVQGSVAGGSAVCCKQHPLRSQTAWAAVRALPLGGHMTLAGPGREKKGGSNQSSLA